MAVPATKAIAKSSTGKRLTGLPYDCAPDIRYIRGLLFESIVIRKMRFAYSPFSVCKN